MIIKKVCCKIRFNKKALRYLIDGRKIDEDKSVHIFVP